MRLAFVAAVQELPPRQRAALLLCDVLGWAAAEAATLLGGSTASINSALQRSRETLTKRYPDGRRTEAADRPDPAHQVLLGRYLKAWEGHDIDAFVALLKEDAAVTMPPWLQWFVGREPVRSFFSMVWRTCDGLRLVPTAANGQPAFAIYERSATDGTWAAHSIHVLTLDTRHDYFADTFSRAQPFSGLWTPAQPSCFDSASLLTGHRKRPVPSFIAQGKCTELSRVPPH